MKTITQLIQEFAIKENLGGPRFQAEFARLVGSLKHDIVVETGNGISTIYLLKEMNSESKLFSVDPNPWTKIPIEDPRHTAIYKNSQDALDSIYTTTGLWDVFLHDSDHSKSCMSWELETAYRYVRPGGLIACDDWNWDNDDAWGKFASNHRLQEFSLGSLKLAYRR